MITNHTRGDDMPKFRRLAAEIGPEEGVPVPIGEGTPSDPGVSIPPTGPVPAPPSPGGGVGGMEAGEVRPVNVDISNVLTAPYQQVGELTQYEHQKQMRQLLQSSTGMSETARNELLDHFTERGLGITPEVDEAISRLSNTFVIDWGDQENQRAIFGTMDTLLKNGGPSLAGAGMNLLSEFYQQAEDNPNFDPTEMLQVLNEWQDPNGDPVKKAVRAWSFMSTSLTDPSDILGSLGIGKSAGKAKKIERMKRVFIELLGALSARPDAEQLASGEMAQLYNAHRQELFNLSKFWAKELMSPVGTGLQHTMAVAEDWPGSLAQTLAQPAINTAAEDTTLLSTLPAPYTAPFGAMGAPLIPKTSVYPGSSGGTYATNPAGLRAPFENVGGLPRAAGTKGKFKRIAQTQSPNEYVAQQMDSQARQLQIMSRLFGGDYQQAISRLDPMLIQQENLLEAKISQYQIFIKQWDDDIRSGTGLADPNFAESMQQTSKDMMSTYDSLLSVYDQMIRILQKRLDFVSSTAGAESGESMTLATGIRQLKTKMDAHLMERNVWWSRIADTFKMRAQMIQVTDVGPLQQAVQALTTSFGGDFGASSALGAAHLQVADQLGKAERQLEQMGDLSAAKRGHLRRQRLQAETDAIKALTGGPSETGAGQSATSPTVMGI